MTSVSFVTTVYNKEAFIRPVAESLFAQTGDFAREYIFVDDGSTDNSLRILEQLTQTRNDCKILTGENSGPSRATNRGLEHAEGDFIKLVDGDDILSPDMTRRLLSAAQKNGHAVVIGNKGGYTLADGQAVDFVEPSGQPAYVIERPLQKLIKNAFFTPTHMLIRRDLVTSTGGCDARIFIQDYSIALRLAREAAFVVAPDAVFYAPVEAEARMSGNVSQTLHDLNAALYHFLHEHPDLDPRLVAYGIQRASGRAWRWARRNGLSGKLRTDILVEYLKSRLQRLRRNDIEVIRKSCAVFQATHPIRDPLT